MIKTVTLLPNQKPTPEQLAELDAASRFPITFDEDSPELTDEELREFRRVEEPDSPHTVVKTALNLPVLPR